MCYQINKPVKTPIFIYTILKFASVFIASSKGSSNYLVGRQLWRVVRYCWVAI